MYTKKYELVPEGNLFRIRAVKDFSNVKKGDLGGLVEDGLILSHKGDCWIYDNAKVYGMCRISENATIKDNAQVSGHAKISENARIDNIKTKLEGGNKNENKKIRDNEINPQRRRGIIPRKE